MTRFRHRAFLLGGASALAIISAVPALAQTAVLPDAPLMVAEQTPALPPTPYTPTFADPPAKPAYIPWTWWVEGGLQVMADQTASIPLLTPAFGVPAQMWGWDAAGGFDYRWNPFWHISGDFRYGANGPRSALTTELACAGSIIACNTPMSGPNSASRNEWDWVADFMIGRDIGVGADSPQIMGGLRVAEIRGTTNGTIAWTATAAPGLHALSAYSQTDTFTGVGPRIAIEGNRPIVGQWSFDYMFGAAELFAWQSANQVSTFLKGNVVGPLCNSGCPITVYSSSTGFVFNPDATLGIAYAITPNAKLALNYHIDAYFNGLWIFNSLGVASNANRIYYGPNLRLTVQY